MRRKLITVLVVLLVVCILAIVISPFVDLPLTVLRPYAGVAVTFALFALLALTLINPRPLIIAVQCRWFRERTCEHLHFASPQNLNCCYLC
jgi:hypothetical protein